MERSHDTSLRDMLDMVARTLKSYKTETGKKQSFKYEVGSWLKFYLNQYCFFALTGDPLLQEAFLSTWPRSATIDVEETFL